MEKSLQTIDKQNNINYGNLAKRRRKNKLLAIERPLTSELQTTFNPFQQSKGYSIPLFISKRNHKQTLPEQSLRIKLQEDCSNSNQYPAPIIAKNNKLKDFFATKKSRYLHTPNQTLEPRSFRRRSLQISAISRPKDNGLFTNRQKLIQLNRKIQFKKIYLKQKEHYEKILSKYGVTEKIDDSDFEKFMME